MDKKNLIPQQTQPVERMTTGQLASELAELCEEVLETGTGIVPLANNCYGCYGSCANNQCGCYSSCSYEGDDAE